MSTLSILSKQLQLGVAQPLVAAASVVGVVIVWYMYSYITSPLRKFPGPFLAGQSVSVMSIIYRTPLTV